MALDYHAYPVLFVDDEPQNHIVFRYAFEDDFTVITARSGQEALDILRRQDIAVLLSDQRMPEMTGVELCARARQIRPDTVRMIVTAYVDSHAAIAAINDGQVSRFVLKPWENAELQDILRTAIGFVDMERALRTMQMRLLGAGHEQAVSSLLAKVFHEVKQSATLALDNAQLALDRLSEVSVALEAAPADAPSQMGAHIRDALAMVEATYLAAQQMAAVAERRYEVLRVSAIGEPESCDAAAVVDHAVRMVRPELDGVAAVQVVLDGSPEVGMSKAALAQVLTNLLLNSAQALRGVASDNAWLRVALHVRSEHAVISIADSGPGIPAADFEHLFEPGFSTKGRGWGLGLATAREIVRGARGEIRVDNEPGAGAQFEIRIPLFSRA